MTLLELVQASTDLIRKDVDIRDSYGISRTTLRGATAHARNMKVDEDLIKAVNWWMKDGAGTARLDMIELYSEARKYIRRTFDIPAHFEIGSGRAQPGFLH
jgi:hypothetical protein